MQYPATTSPDRTHQLARTAPRRQVSVSNVTPDPLTITPSHVYARVDLLNRRLDVLLGAAAADATAAPRSFETEIRSDHLYQVQIASIQSLHDWQVAEDVSPIPLVVSRPDTRWPADVARLTELLIAETDQIAESRNERCDLPTNDRFFAGKTPSDSHRAVVAADAKLRRLYGRRSVSLEEVLAQTNRVVDDARRIMIHSDPASRFKSYSEITTDDSMQTATAAMVELRRAVADVLAKIDDTTSAEPAIPAGVEFTPYELFLQTQLVLAEFNRIKTACGCRTSTPLGESVERMEDGDIANNLRSATHLIKQLPRIRSAYTASLTEQE
ncbi:MAG: hypothetical protein QF805_04910 [Pirellulaceae bacterium]|nr:hypothetical protein [Pirellulaceae bacterium]